MIYDLIIVGGGPAGVAAGVYAARKRLKTALITPEFGGQSIVSSGIENWIGTIKIPGIVLAQNLRAHLLAYADSSVDVKETEAVVDIKKTDVGFAVTTDKDSYQAKAVLVTTGSHRRKLDIPGAKEFDNKGISYCASCDGPIFAGQDVVIIGGGNAAFESAAQLLAYAKSVTILNRGEKLKADEMTVEHLKINPNLKIILNAEPVEIHGEGFVTGITYKDTKTGQNEALEAPGIFVEIGLLPTTYFVKNILTLNQYGQIPINPRNQQTEIPGMWAAGDCTDTLYHQNNIAAGDAVRALEDIYLYLNTH